jgi:hypothetical protein
MEMSGKLDASAAFLREKYPPDIKYRIDGYVRSRADTEILKKRNISHVCRESNHDSWVI